MNINSVLIRNFLIIGEADIVLKDRGLTRIAGENLDDATSSSNGSGKSCILEAVYWALFGDTLRSLKSADGVINRTVGKNCSVVVELEEDGKQYRIERYRKHSKKKNNLYFYVGGVDSRGKDNRETQEFIESVIGMDKTSFSNSIVFGQGHGKNLKRFSEMTDAEKKATMERVLDIEVFAHAYEESKKQKKELLSRLDLIDKEFELLSSSLASLKEELKSHKKSEKEDAEAEAVRLKKLNEEIDSKLSDIAVLESKILDIPDPEPVSDLEDMIVECTKLSDVEHKKGLKLDALYQEKRDKLVSTIGMLRGQSDDLTKKITSLSDGKDAGDSCSYCGSIINVSTIEEQKDYFQFEINDRRHSLDSLDSKLISLSQSYNSKKVEINSLLDEIRDVSLQFTKRIMKSEKYASYIASIKEQINTKREHIEAIKGGVDPVPVSNFWKKEIKRVNGNISDIKSRIKILDDESGSINEEKNYLEFWSDGFSRKGIRSFILDKVIPFLNERLNRYLSILTDNGIEARFNTTKQIASGEYRENFNLDISNRNAADTYEGNSGGERRRIDLAVALAFNDFISSRSGKRFNILLLDEVFEGVDSEGLYYVIKVLEDLAARKSSVFVITHRDELKSYFNDEIMLRRKDGVSFVA